MFERFSGEARQVVIRAQEEARAARSPSIGPAHVLLAIRSVDGPGRAVLQGAGVEESRLREVVRSVGSSPEIGLDADALAALGIDLDSVRRTVEATFGPGALDADRHRGWRHGHLRFAEASKQALERALRSAVRRGDRALDSGHLLVGILEVGDPALQEVLSRLDIDPHDLHRRAAHRPDAA